MTPLHEPTDYKKLNEITASMEIDGWQGQPILVVDMGDYYQAITGSHRIAAAEIAGIEPAMQIIDADIDDATAAELELFTMLIDAKDDQDRLDAVTALADMGLADESDVAVMAAELNL